MILFLFIIPSLFATSTIKMLTQSTRAFPEHWWEQLRKQGHRNTARVKYETVTWSNAFSKNSTCMLLGRMKKYPYKKKDFWMHNTLWWSLINYWEPRGASQGHGSVWNRQSLILLSSVCVWSHWSQWCMQGSNTDVCVCAG